MARIRLNDDKELVEEIKEQLKKNSWFCPCKIQKIQENKCPCEEFRNMEVGECHCGLFVKEV